MWQGPWRQKKSFGGATEDQVGIAARVEPTLNELSPQKVSGPRMAAQVSGVCRAGINGVLLG